MTASATPRHPSIYLLGDHLDAALAMGEDLLTEKVALADAAQPSPWRGWCGRTGSWPSSSPPCARSSSA